MAKCKICGKTTGLNDLRFGACWDCATAESIIEDGTDMHDEKIAVSSTSMEKLKALIKLGWHKD